MLRFFLWTSFVIWSFLVAAQKAPLSLSFQHLTPEEGLSQGTNAYVFQDSRGFIWMSSLESLNRFDGIEVKVYKPIPNDSTSLLGRNVTSRIFEDTTGNLWFTTNKAINCYQRKYDNFKSFQLSDSLGQLITEDYYAFHLDTHDLWLRMGLGKKGRLHKFNMQTEKNTISYPLDGHRCQVILDEIGDVKQIVSSMFFTKTGIEITDLHRQGQKRYYPFDRHFSPSFFSRNVYVENDTTLWIGSMSGLTKFDPQTGKIKNHIRSSYRRQALGTVWSVIPYLDDYLFIGTLRGGVLLFDKNTQTLIQQFAYNERDKNSINSNMVRELYLDQQSNLWVSRYEGGVAYTNINKIKFPILKSEQGKRIYTLFEQKKDSSIWIAADRTWKKRPQKHENTVIFKTFQRKNTSNTAWVERQITFPISFFFEDCEEQFYAISGKWLLKYHETKQQFELTKDFDGKINFAYTLKDGTSLLSLNDSLTILKQPHHACKTTSFASLGTYRVAYYTHIFEDQQERLYLAKNAANLLVFNKKDNQYQLTKNIKEIGECYDFYEDVEAQIIWVATFSGLMKLNAVTLEQEMLNEPNHGIPNETFYSVSPDEEDGLWLTSNRGLLHYKIKEKKYHRFTVADGLQSNEFLPNATIKALDGKIWLGSINGLNVFASEKIREATSLPKVQLTTLRINDTIATQAIQIEELPLLKLSYDENTVSFNFAALEFSDAKNNQFEYQLLGKGYNKADEWVNSGSVGFARFANLAPGKYQFNVRAANSDGVWNQTPKTLPIVVTPPFWMTWWFYLFCTLAVSAIVYAWFQYRLQQALKIERLRVKISSDLHDDVGTLLSGLAMQTEILEMTALDKDKPRLQRVGELARSAMSRMRDTVWAIDARKDKFENLIDRMREHAEETLTARDIVFDLEIENLDLKKNLPTDVRQNLYLIYKEAITNIAKHANASEVKVRLEKVGTAFEMRIEDNGKAVQKNYKTTGAGLMNMKMRAEQIGGTLEFYQRDGFGVLLRRKD